MTARGRPDRLDDLPAWGLREDAFDDDLRRGNTLARERYRADEDFSPDPEVWLNKPRMSHTEVSLRLGRFLLQSPIIGGNVVATLGGYELTRRESPQFPVARFLTEWLGFTPRVNRRYKWRGHYALPGVERRLVVTFDRLDGHISARLVTGNRLIVFLNGGLVNSASGSAERRMLHAALGRAMVWPGWRQTDHLAICVPRSGPFRRAIREFRLAHGVQRLGLHLLTVDRITGTVGGLVDLETLCMRT